MAAKKRKPQPKAKAKSAPVKKAGPLRDPVTGLFVKRTVANARKLATKAKRIANKARTERSRAYKKAAAGAKQPKTRDRNVKAYQKATKKATRAMQRAEAAERQLREVEEQRARLPRTYEFGVAYVASRRDRSHDVNFNVHLSRKDGRGITHAEAVTAIERIAGNGVESVRDTYRVSGVEWTRSGGRRGEWSSRSVRSGSASDVDNFQSILADTLFNNNGEGLRMGALREDDAWLAD